MVRRLIYHSTAWLLRSPFLPFSKIHLLHPERARLPGPCLLACNHISHFDPPFIATVVRRHVHWMATAGLFANRFVGGWLRAASAFPVDRSRPDRTSVKTALARLRTGHMVGVFPEGGIRDGAASVLGGADLIPGLGALAEIAEAPVLPCVILGTDRLYARSSYRPFQRTSTWIGFGDLLHPEGTGKATRLAFEKKIGDALRALCREMTDHFHLTPDDLPQPPKQRMARTP
jgi:1-acyl-sn-glycerol-3-phosphate acyltransferase